MTDNKINTTLNQLVSIGSFALTGTNTIEYALYPAIKNVVGVRLAAVAGNKPAIFQNHSIIHVLSRALVNPSTIYGRVDGNPVELLGVQMADTNTGSVVFSSNAAIPFKCCTNVNKLDITLLDELGLPLTVTATQTVNVVIEFYHCYT